MNDAPEKRNERKPGKNVSMIPVIAMLTVSFFGLDKFGIAMPPWIIGVALGFLIIASYRSVGYKIPAAKTLMDSVVIAYFSKLLAVLSLVFIFS